MQSANKSSESSYSCTGRRMASQSTTPVHHSCAYTGLDLNNKIFSCEGNTDPHTFLPLGTSVHTCQVPWETCHYHHMNQVHKQLLMLQSLWTLQQFSCPKYSRAVCFPTSLCLSFSVCFWYQSDLQQGLSRKEHSDTQHKEGSPVTQWESNVLYSEEVESVQFLLSKHCTL